MVTNDYACTTFLTTAIFGFQLSSFQHYSNKESKSCMNADSYE